MKNVPIIILLLASISFPSFAAKKGYSEGYIVTLEGDTLRGQIKDRDPDPFASLYQKVRFIEKGKKRPKKYDAGEISGYGYHKMNFRSVKLAERTEKLKIRYYISSDVAPIFLKVIRESENIIHYEQEFIHDDNFYLDSYPLFQVVGKNEMVRVTQGIFGLKKKRLSEYFSECEALINALDSDELEDPEDVFDFYNENCLSVED